MNPFQNLDSDDVFVSFVYNTKKYLLDLTTPIDKYALGFCRGHRNLGRIQLETRW